MFTLDQVKSAARIIGLSVDEADRLCDALELDDRPQPVARATRQRTRKVAARSAVAVLEQPTLILDDPYAIYDAIKLDAQAYVKTLPAPTPAPVPSLAWATCEVPMDRMGMQPSNYQRNIFGWILYGKGHGMVNAVAGSGKTSTLVAAANLLAEDAIFVAFNAHIAKELKDRLAGTRMTARTIHSVGLAALKTTGNNALANPTVQGDKYDKIAKRYAHEIVRVPGPNQQKTFKALKSLSHMVRVTLTTPTHTADLLNLCDRYSIELPDAEIVPLITAVLPHLIAEGRRMAEKQGIIDYDDMLYLPATDKSYTVTTARWIMVDECQDLNAAQRAIVQRMCASDGRMLFVGDVRQAIYGFAGADSDSFWTIQREMGATLLPLSICYRCPTSHIELARSIVPTIEARPNAPQGTVNTITEDKLSSAVQTGDLIICRLTSPLISTCMRLIANGIAAKVRGRDIGKQLTDLIRAVADMPSFSWEQFDHWLSTYIGAQVARLGQREGNEQQIESLMDRAEGIRLVYIQAINVTSVDGLCAHLESLFSDDRPPVELATVHRVKGDQRAHVFILQPSKMPLIWKGQRPDELEQEMNLRYVALTRSTDTLTFVEDSPTPKIV